MVSMNLGVGNDGIKQIPVVHVVDPGVERGRKPHTHVPVQAGGDEMGRIRAVMQVIDQVLHLSRGKIGSIARVGNDRTIHFQGVHHLLRNRGSGIGQNNGFRKDIPPSEGIPVVPGGIRCVLHRADGAVRGDGDDSPENFLLLLRIIDAKLHLRLRGLGGQCPPVRVQRQRGEQHSCGQHDHQRHIAGGSFS